MHWRPSQIGCASVHINTLKLRASSYADREEPMAVVYAVLMGFAVLELTRAAGPWTDLRPRPVAELSVYHIDNMMLFIYHLEFCNKM
jgi:hypothetical protein